MKNDNCEKGATENKTALKRKHLKKDNPEQKTFET